MAGCTASRRTRQPRRRPTRRRGNMSLLMSCPISVYAKWAILRIELGTFVACKVNPHPCSPSGGERSCSQGCVMLFQVSVGTLPSSCHDVLNGCHCIHNAVLRVHRLAQHSGAISYPAGSGEVERSGDCLSRRAVGHPPRLARCRPGASVQPRKIGRPQTEPRWKARPSVRRSARYRSRRDG